MNVLLTSVGRRGYLVDYFRDSLRGTGNLIVTNTTGDAPGMYAADEAIVVPGSHEPDYVGVIEHICRDYNVGLLCSLHDLDTFIISQHSDRLSRIGVVPVLPSGSWAKMCLDKHACGLLLMENRFNVPWTSVSLAEAEEALANGRVHFPLIVKARLGFGSAGVHFCRDLGELRMWHAHVTKELLGSVVQQFHRLPLDAMVLIQEALAGQEYCIGVVNDLEGRHAAHFACQVHTMRAGESDTATTVECAVFGDLPVRLSQLTQHRGIWGIDVIVRDGVPHIIDINPRFTGDYPFQHLAGANIPAALVAWARGDLPEPRWLSPAVGVRGYKNLVPMLAPT